MNRSDVFSSIGELMEIAERISKQVELINEILSELSTETSYRGIERLVQLAIQALLDLGLIVISALNARRPSRYSEVGYILKDLGLVNPEDAELMKGMAGLRNILIHAYAIVDRNKIIKASKRLKEDIPRIVSKIVDRLKFKNLDPEECMVGDDVVDTLSKILNGRVRAAFIFGGRVKGYCIRCDYDIAILMPKEYDLIEVGKLQVDIAKALGVDEELINLVVLNDSNPEIILEALDGLPIIVEDYSEVLDIKVKALMELLDMHESYRIISK